MWPAGNRAGSGIPAVSSTVAGRPLLREIRQDAGSPPASRPATLLRSNDVIRIAGAALAGERLYSASASRAPPRTSSRAGDGSEGGLSGIRESAVEEPGPGGNRAHEDSGESARASRPGMRGSAARGPAGRGVPFRSGSRGRCSIVLGPGDELRVPAITCVGSEPEVSKAVRT
jgi:anti-sigma factor RsiW